MNGFRERDEAATQEPGDPTMQRADVSDYCSECGRPWRGPLGTRPERAAPAFWWPGILVVVGLYLVASFGTPAWKSIEVPGGSYRFIATAACLTAGTEQDYSNCDPTSGRLGASFGLLCLVFGLRAVVRRICVPGRHQGLAWHRTANEQAPRNRLIDPILTVWTLGEAACQSACHLLLIVFCFIGASRILLGVPLSGTFVAQTVGRTFGVVIAALQ